MRLVTDKEDPNLVGILDDMDELDVIAGWIDCLNKDLIDSGFEKYQYKAEKQGPKAYIRRI